MVNSKTSTFWEVISDNQIEIPVIQRDYAQGRKNARVTPIRNKFVSDIINALKSKDDSKLHLDFVYGRIEGKDKQEILKRNEEAIRNVLKAVQGYAGNLDMLIKYDLEQKLSDGENLSEKKLIPLDGQQRLTTLFLLHWYLVMRINHESKNDILNKLSGFKYRTRKSTTEFCEYLINIPPDKVEQIFDPDRQLSKQIEKSTFFFKKLKKDPSVDGMLNMLDSFHEILKYEHEEMILFMWNNLTLHNKITFDFLDIDQLEQTDELYVKMNARGKHLTDFEHFKAWFQEYIKKNDSVNVLNDKWEEKIDTIWLDLFWNLKNNKTYQVDDTIYNFIKNVNLYEYIVQTPEKDINDYLIERIRKSSEENSFISFDIYENTNFFSTESLSFLFKTLDNLTDVKMDAINIGLENIYCKPFSSDRTIKLSHFFLTEKSNPSLWDRVFYYALLLFINDDSFCFTDKDIIQLNSWMRICRNLIYNTYIQNPENFIKAVKAIRKLSIYKYNIENELLRNDVIIEFFEFQAKEEKRKLEYFKDSKWKDKILQYENHEYFYGQIDFIFNLLDDPTNFNDFEKYGDKLSILFSGNIEKNNFELHRSLLAKGDYALSSGYKYSFCKSEKGSLRVLNDNWRKVFNNEKKRSYLKALLDETRELKEVIENNDLNDWRKYVIKYPAVIRYCKNRLFDFTNQLDIRLLKNSTYNGKHTDLYLFILFQELISKETLNFSVKHIDINNYRTKENYPLIKICSYDILIMTINYSYTLNSDKKGFVLKSFDSELRNEFDNYFHDFEKDENETCYKIINEISEMDKIIETICSGIQQIDKDI